MKQVYAVMKLNKTIEIITSLGMFSTTKDIPLNWSPGMVGALAVFSTLEKAQKEAGDKYDIEVLMVPESEEELTKKGKRKI